MSAVPYDEALIIVKNGSRSRDSILTLLKTMRLNKIRESRLVIEFGTLALKNFGNGLGDEKWTILEQVFLAALDTGNRKLAEDCIQELIQKFKDSSRVSRLLGMQNECLKHYNAATETYSKMLEENPANALALKRKVAIFKSQGKMTEAVKELNEYLEQMPGDLGGWQELVDMYLSMSKYDAAAFCCEELILHDPMNHLLHCRLAEIYYTMGSSHLATARKYFAQSLEIKKNNNARALYGMAQCCEAMHGDIKAKHNTSVTSALHDYARSELSSLYSSCRTDMNNSVEKLLDQQSDTLND